MGSFVIGEVEVTNEVSLSPSSALYEGAVLADGDLTVTVHSFYYDMGGTKGKYSGSVGNSVTDNQTNYVYLNDLGALVVNTTGYPVANDDLHIRLARVIASGGIILRVILERAFFTASSYSTTVPVPASRLISTSGGLQGGGDLTEDRTLSPVYGSASSTVCEGNDSRLSNDRTASGIRTSTTVVSVSSADAPSAGQVLKATSSTAASWSNIPAGDTGQIQINSEGVLGVDPYFAYDLTNHSLLLGPNPFEYPDNPLNIAADVASYTQVIFQNFSSSNLASTDLVLVADNGDDSSYFLDLGINSSTYDVAEYDIAGPNDAYLDSYSGNLTIGTALEGKVVKFHTGGTRATNLRATVDDSGINLPTGNTYRINGTALPSLTSSAPSDVTKATASVGVASDAARSDHKHDVSTGTPGAVAVGDSAAEGTATSLARSDHKHSVSSGAPSNVGTSNSEGTATTFSRSDHVHNVPFSAVQTALGAASGAISLNSQNLTSVGTINGTRDYGPQSSDPSSPAPSAGDRYYNTSLDLLLTYDGGRSKWLSPALPPIYAGAQGLTAAGSFFRGLDGLAFGTNIGIPVQKGTLIALQISMTTSVTSEIEVLVDSSVIATVSVTTAGLTSSLSLNADFNTGLMKFRNKSTGATVHNVQITAQMKRRA